MTRHLDDAPDAPEVLTPVEARQATGNLKNYRVLMTSLLLAIIAAALLYAWFYAMLPWQSGT